MNPVLENAILWMIGALVIWQIVVPMIRERPLLPLFRRKWDADQRLIAARQRHDYALAKLEEAKINAKTSEVELETSEIMAKIAKKEETK